MSPDSSEIESQPPRRIRNPNIVVASEPPIGPAADDRDATMLVALDREWSVPCVRRLRSGIDLLILDEHVDGRTRLVSVGQSKRGDRPTKGACAFTCRRDSSALEVTPEMSAMMPRTTRTSTSVIPRRGRIFVLRIRRGECEGCALSGIRSSRRILR